MSEERRLRGKPERQECEELKAMGWKGWGGKGAVSPEEAYTQIQGVETDGKEFGRVEPHTHLLKFSP